MKRNAHQLLSLMPGLSVCVSDSLPFSVCLSVCLCLSVSLNHIFKLGRCSILVSGFAWRCTEMICWWTWVTKPNLQRQHNECWLQDTKLQSRASLETAHKGNAELQKQLSDLKAELQMKDGIMQVRLSSLQRLSSLYHCSCCYAARQSHAPCCTCTTF